MHLLFFRQDNECADFLSIMAQAPFFQKVDQGVEEHRHDTQEDDGHKEPIHFEYLRGHSDTTGYGVSG